MPTMGEIAEVINNHLYLLESQVTSIYNHIIVTDDKTGKLFETSERLSIALNDRIKNLEQENFKLKSKLDTVEIDLRMFKENFNTHYHIEKADGSNTSRPYRYGERIS